MNVLDLFCGAGGFSEGFRQAGFTTSVAIDSWPIAVNSFKKNHPEAHVHQSDIRKLAYADVDLIIGGPPCPDFSPANATRDPQRGMLLVQEFFRLVDAIKPDYWCIENVPLAERHIRPLVLSRGGNTYVLNAADYGVPQRRRRMFGMNFSPPIPTHSKTPSSTLDGRILEPWVTVRDVLGTFLEGDFLKNMSGKLTPSPSDKGKVGRQSPFQSVNVPSRTIRTVVPEVVSKDDVERYWSTQKRSMKGDFASNSPFFHSQEPARTLTVSPPRIVTVKDLERFNQHRKRIGLLPAPDPTDKPSRTILASEGENTEKGMILETSEGGYRKLSVNECAMLQSFPETYVFSGSPSNKYRQIGNAVPPLLARAIAEAIPR